MLLAGGIWVPVLNLAMLWLQAPEVLPKGPLSIPVVYSGRWTFWQEVHE